MDQFCGMDIRSTEIITSNHRQTGVNFVALVNRF